MVARMEIRRDLRTLREKLCYFLMSAAGAAIGYALTQFGDATKVSVWFYVVALIFWAVSFYAGYKFILIDEKQLWVNFELTKILAEIPESERAEKAPLAEVNAEKVTERVGSVERWRSAQFGFLAIGAACFSIGSILSVILT